MVWRELGVKKAPSVNKVDLRMKPQDEAFDKARFEAKEQ